MDYKAKHKIYNYKSHIENSVPSFKTISKEFLDSTNKVVDRIHFSGSGSGKFVIHKNCQVVATLFTTRNNLQAEYGFPIEILNGDVFRIDFKNTDNVAFDMYVSFSETEL